MANNNQQQQGRGQQRQTQPQQRPQNQAVARQPPQTPVKSRYADRIAQVAREIEDDSETIAGLLQTEPSSAVFGQFVNEVKLAINKAYKKNGSNPLLDADLGSLMDSIREAAGFGYSLNPRLGEAFLIPRSGMVEMQSGYKGLIKLGYRSGIISSMHGECVYKGEEYKRVGGSENPRIIHTPDDVGEKRTNKWDDIVCAYAVVFIADSTRAIYQVAPRWRLKLARGSGTLTDAWRNHPDAMCRKTALIMVANELPRSDKLRQFHLAVQRELEMEADVAEYVVTMEDRSESAGRGWQRAVEGYGSIGISEQQLIVYLGLDNSNDVTDAQLNSLEQLFTRARSGDQAAIVEFEKMRTGQSQSVAAADDSESLDDVDPELSDQEPVDD